MKKPKLTKLKSKLPKGVPKAFKRAKAPEDRVTEALQGVPRITNETVTEHREEVLRGARKYIYPLQHSRHSIVRISVWLLVTVLITFFVYCGLALYQFQSTSGFVYGITRVIPFPVAKAGSSWVGYESYLFDLRRYMHYYQTQQAANFSTKDGKAQLKLLKGKAMKQVIQDAYVKQLASKYHVSVSDKTVNDYVTLVRNQNRLGSSQHVFDDVLNEFWGWSEADFKRQLKQQLLQQAVVAKLDTATDARAQAALSQLNSGADFATVAAQNSDDNNTKTNGGQYQSAITPNDPNLAPITTAELFKLKPGQVSPIINAGFTLEILKVIDGTSTSVHAAHIQFTFQPITTYTSPIQTKHPAHQYISTQ